MALLELKNVVASYGNINALKGISLSVPEGKIVTLIGANGAGKSTTMRTIMGLMKPKEGDVLFKGKSIVGMYPNEIVSHGMVLVPEGRQILQNMTVLENLQMGAYQRRDKAEMAKDMNHIFDVIEEINKAGTTVFLVEQNARKALRIADYAYVMETGKIVMQGPAAEIASDPNVMAAYLGGRK